MNKSSIILALLATSLICSQAEYLGKNPHGIDIFTIDMNLAPKYRYNETATFFKTQVN
jgi:hypothetical protein